MNPNENGHHGLYHNGVPGVIERDPAQSGPFTQEHISLDEETIETDAGRRQPARRDGRKRLIGALLLLLIVVLGGAGLWLIFGGRKTRITVPVHDPARKTDQTAGSHSNDDVTAQAIAEVRGANAAATPAASPSPAPAIDAGKIVTPATPITIPMEGVGGAIRPSANDAAVGQSGASSGSATTAKQGETLSRRNTERSIRCAPTPAPVSARQPLTGPAARPLIPAIPDSALLRRTEQSVVLPPFGVLLPVRTLGALYTLRQSLARFELTRDVRGDNWQMKKGTILVGRQLGNERDRAYLDLMGFIDPASGKLVRLSGDLLGADGAPGLKGKLHQVSSPWKRVLDRAATGGLSLAQAALARGNTTTIVLPGAVAPELTSLARPSRREFVEVQAGSAAYVMITRLPEQTEGIDAPPVEESNSVAGRTGDEALSDEELAVILESGSPEQIRAALPRMSPALRRLAEIVLKETKK